MARSLALVSDPAAPRSVVVLIGPPPRRCQRLLSTNRRTARSIPHCRKTPAFSAAYVVAGFRGKSVGAKKNEKSLEIRQKNLSLGSGRDEARQPDWREPGESSASVNARKLFRGPAPY